MITVPTHKRHESPVKHSKTIHVFTSGPLIVTLQFHSRKKLLKGLKWPLQNRHQCRSRAGVMLSCCKIKWKGVFADVGWRCSQDATCIYNVLKLPPKTLGFSLWFYCRPGSPDQSKLIPTLGSWLKPKGPFKLLINILNVRNIISLNKIRVPTSKSIYFET
jgi:hypothetical protein